MSETTNARVRRAWTDADVEYLKANASSGAKAIATALGRTEPQVRQKALNLQVSLRQPGNRQGRRTAVETQTVDSI